jgi:hypothetical protein
MAVAAAMVADTDIGIATVVATAPTAAPMAAALAAIAARAMIAIPVASPIRVDVAIRLPTTIVMIATNRLPTATSGASDTKAAITAKRESVAINRCLRPSTANAATAIRATA